MDRRALDEVQMHGQDIPWLLRHWANARPEHAVLVWDPKDGPQRRWTYRELHDEVTKLAAGLAARGIAQGDKVLIHSDNCPEMVFAWLACATIGAVGVTTNTKSVAAEVAYFVDKAQCVAAITQPQYAGIVAEAAATLKWIAVTEDDSGEAPTSSLSGDFVPFADLFGDATQWEGRPAEPMLPFGIMFTSG